MKPRARRLLALAAIGVVAGAGAVVGGGAWLRSPAGQAWVAARLLAQAQGVLVQGSFSVLELDTDYTSRLCLTDVVVRDGSGKSLAHVARVCTRYDLASWIQALAAHQGWTQPTVARVHELTVDGATVDATIDADGRLDLLTLFGPPSDAPWTGLPLDVRVDSLRIQNTTFRLTQQGSTATVYLSSLEAAVTSSGPRISVGGLHAAGTVLEPIASGWRLDGEAFYDGVSAGLPSFSAAIGPLVARGEVSAAGLDAKPSFHLATELEPSEIDAIERWLGLDLRARGRASASLTADGPYDALRVHAQLRGAGTTRGEIIADATLDFAADRFPWTGALDLRQVHADDWVEALPTPIAVDGRFSGEGAGTTWPDDLTIAGRYEGRELRIGDEALDAVRADLRLHNGVLRFGSAEAEIPQARVRADGTLDLRTGAVQTDANIVVDLSMPRLHLRGLRGEAAVLARATGNVFDAALPVEAAGTARVTGFGYADLVSAEPIAIEWTALHRDHDVTAEATLNLGSTRLPEGFVASGGSLHARVAAGRATVDGTLVAGDRYLAEFAAAADLKAQSAEIARVVLRPTPGQEWRSRAPIVVAWRDDGVERIDAELVSPRGTLAVRGHARQGQGVDLTVRAGNLDVGTLAELRPEWFDGWWGLVDGTVTLAGPWHAPLVHGEVAAKRLWMPHVVGAFDIAATFDSELGGVRIAGTARTQGAELLRVDARLPAVLDLDAPHLNARGDVDARVDLWPTDLARLRQIGDLEIPVLDGTFAASVHITGRLADPSIAASAEARVAVPGWDAPASLHVEAARESEAFTGFADLAEGRAVRASASFTATNHLNDVLAWALTGAKQPDLRDPSTYAENIDLNVDTVVFPASRVVALTGLPLTTEGDLDAHIRATGALTAPQLRAEARWLEGRLGELPVERGQMQIESRAEHYGVDVDLGIGGGSFAVRGEVDPRESGRLMFSVDAKDFPVAAIRALDLGISDASGTLDVSGELRGSFQRPHPDLRATLRDGRIDLLPFNLRYDQMTADVVVLGDRAQLKHFETRTRALNPVGLDATIEAGPGRIEGTADAIYSDPPRLRADFQLRRALLSATPTRTVATSGTLHAEGKWPALEIGGRFSLDQANINIETDILGEGGPTTVDPAIRVHRSGQNGAVAAIPQPPWYAPMHADVTLDLNRRAEVRASMPILDDFGALGAMVTRADVFTRLDAPNLRVQLDNGQPNVDNDVTVVEGSVSVLRTKLQIREGKVRFTGDPFDPILDITATRDQPAGTIEAHITGTALTPDVDFRSDAYDETDILTILVTGSSPEELTNSEGSGAWENLLGSMLVNSVFGRSSGGSLRYDPDGSLRYRVPVSQSIYAEITLNPLADERENTISVLVEASLGPHLTAEGSFGNENNRVEAFWQVHF